MEKRGKKWIKNWGKDIVQIFGQIIVQRNIGIFKKIHDLTL